MKTELEHPLNVVPRFTMQAQAGSDWDASRPEPSAFAQLEMEVDLRREEPFTRAFGTGSNLVLVRHLAGPMTAEVYSGERFFRGSLPRGGILIVPRNSTCRLTLAQPGENLYVHIRPRTGEKAAPSGLAPLEPALVGNDETLNALVDLVRFSAVGQLNATSAAALPERLTRMIVTHLARNFSPGSFKLPTSLRVRATGLARHSNTVVTRAIEYMLDNIDRSITLEDIGDFVGRSPGQLGRLFKAHLGQSPYRYLLGLRIERARVLLATTTMPIAQLALECGFSNQEHLTRHFRHLCGTTPAAYRRSHH